LGQRVECRPFLFVAGGDLRRVEDRIRTWKATGATRQPYWDAPANEAWLNNTLVALALIAWAQLISFDGSELRAEPSPRNHPAP
jgi:hypothetical protein